MEPEQQLAYELGRITFLFFPLLGGALLHGICLRFNWLAFLAKPIDFGATVRGRRLFGDNKTYRGLILPGIGTGLTMALQGRLADRLPVLRSLEYYDYSSVFPLLLGFSLGIAAMVSELPNSFLKRQLDIAPGKPAGGEWEPIFFFLDQVDLLVGIWLVLAFIIPVTLERVLLSLAFMFVVHQVITLVGYSLRMRKTRR
jgi:CDP-archaeol synthase